MVAQGHPNKIIAGVLNISSWTVCTHLRRVFAKLGVTSRAAMVARLHELAPSGLPCCGDIPLAPAWLMLTLYAKRSNGQRLEASTKPTSISPARRQTA